MSSIYDHYHPNTPRCNHIFETNLQCKSPALRGKSFCYWHQQNRKHRDKFTVPLLETEHAIQATLSQVLRELHEGKIDVKRANSMFYGLSLAMYNVRRMSFSTDRDHIIDLPPAMLDFVGADVPVCPREDDHVGADVPVCPREDDHVGADVLVCPGEDDHVGADVPVCPGEDKHVGADVPVCPPDSAPSSPSRPPRGTALTDQPIHEAINDESSDAAAHEAWKSGASAPRCGPTEGGALAPVDPSDPRHATATSPIDHRTSSFIKKVLRIGPSHPNFAEVSRLYDRYISARQAG